MQLKFALHHLMSSASQLGNIQRSNNLKCEIEKGWPPPNIVWSRFEAGSLIDLETQVESFNVDKPGLYLCKAENQFGRYFRTFRVRHYDKFFLTAVTTAVTILVISAISLYWRNRREKRVSDEKHTSEKIQRLFEKPLIVDHESDLTKPLNYQISNLPFNRDYELSRELFVLIKKIGEGQFGKVYKGKLKFNADNSALLMAVKTPNDLSDFQQYNDLIGEYKIMTNITAHINVISLFGICYVKNTNELYLLTELCELGSLEEYLKQHERESLSTLLGYSYQASRGMEHLAMHNIIHRDLALRNLLLTNKHIVKISNFEMSRCQTIYKERLYEMKTVVPFRWMAPETVIDGDYTGKSDVWSFGVVLWEMFMCGTPYYKEGIHKIAELYSWLHRGNRLEKPEKAPPEMYDLMLDCWLLDPKLRPSFNNCKERLGQYLEQTKAVMYSLIENYLERTNYGMHSVNTNQLPNERRIPEDRSITLDSSIGEDNNAVPDPTFASVNDLEMKPLSDQVS